MPGPYPYFRHCERGTTRRPWHVMVDHSFDEGKIHVVPGWVKTLSSIGIFGLTPQILL